VGFGMNAWVVSEEIYLPSDTAEITVGAPDGATVTINGVPVDEGYIVGREILRTELHHGFDLQPEGQLYVVDGLQGPVELKAHDAQGRELTPVKISDTLIHFAPETDHSFCFIAPEEATVTVNGVDITGTVCTDVFPGLAPGEILCYQAEDLFTDPQIRVTVDGEEVSPEELLLGQAMIPNASAQIDGEMEEFLLSYTKCYVDFISNKNRNYKLNFARLSANLVQGSTFYDRMLQTAYAIRHAHTSGLTYHNMDCSDLIPLGEDRWLCRISYKAEYYFIGEYQSVESDSIVLLTRVDGKYKVLDMDSPPVIGQAE